MPKKLERDHYVLLKHSQVIDEYPDLKALLEEQDDITEELLETLSPEMKSFILEVVPALAQLAEEEWEPEDFPDEDRGDDRGEWLLCQLCGTPNKYIYYIHNQYNGMSLNVGSHCITKFGRIQNKHVLSPAEYRNRMARMHKQNQLNKLFGGIIRVVDEWDSTIDDSPEVIPYELERPWEKLGRLLKDKIEYYISGNCKKDEEQDVFSEIDGLLKQRKLCLSEIASFLESNTRKYPATQGIARWSRSRGDADIIMSWIKEDGEITQRTAHRITEPEFMKSIAKELELSYSSIGFKNWTPDPDRQGYYVNCDPLVKVRLFCGHSELLKKYGGKLFRADAPGPDAINILDICEVFNDERSYYMVSEVLIDILVRTGLKYYTLDYRFNEIVFKEADLDLYIIIDLKDFIKKHFLLAYNQPKKAPQEMIDYIFSTHWKRMDSENIKTHERLYK